MAMERFGGQGFPHGDSMVGVGLDSRKTLLGIADFVIPGHGKMFKVEK